MVQVRESGFKVVDCASKIRCIAKNHVLKIFHSGVKNRATNLNPTCLNQVSTNMTNEILNFAKRIKAIADTGLLYNQSGYDVERYTELKEIGLELMAFVTGKEPAELATFYSPQDYPTPKVDVRGLLLNQNNQILLAQE